MKYLLLLMFALPLQAHEDIFTAGYVFNEGLTIGYHRIHKEQGEFGYYINGFHQTDTDHYSELGSVTSSEIERQITEFIDNTVTTSETVTYRAVKCNKHGKCHEYGPPITTTIETTTTTTQPITYTVFDVVQNSTFVQTKRKYENLILNVGVNYSYRNDVFIYGGLGVARDKYLSVFSNGQEQIFERKTQDKLNVNLGLMVNDQDGYGLDFGYNTHSNNLYVGFSYEW